MTLYDTHAHFGDEDDIDAIYARAAEAGVSRILAIGGSEELNRNALRTSGRVALGWDRDQILAIDDQMRELPGLLSQNKTRVAAIGEIGLDCHYEPQTLKVQCDLFARQLVLADELGLPVVITRARPTTRRWVCWMMSRGIMATDSVESSIPIREHRSLPGRRWIGALWFHFRESRRSSLPTPFEHPHATCRTTGFSLRRILPIWLLFH